MILEIIEAREGTFTKHNKTSHSIVVVYNFMLVQIFRGKQFLRLQELWSSHQMQKE